MSRTRAYKQDTLDTQLRFFSVMAEIVGEGRVPGGLAGYCDAYGIDRRHYYAQRKDFSRGYFEVAWLTPLVRHYGISATWLLTGIGKKFRGREPHRSIP